VAIDCRPHLDQPQEVVSEAVRPADASAKVLIVRNTVADAVALFEAIRGRLVRAGRLDLLLTVEGVPTLHHGRFALEDRLLLDQAVEAGLGRGAARPRGLVIVGTQTLEQSLDIDADLLVTDLCPMDVLLHRIGRLHRHPGSRRPDGFVDPRCIVLVPAERDLTPFIDGKTHGLGSVYADLRVVQATRDLLEDHTAIEIPTMSRALVEQATHPDALEQIVRDGGSAWQRHAATVLGEDYSSRGSRRYM
jgi:CRISPR-associated endonuclease/helicase Cas3